jgi:2-keto-4-pentenoate hydratase/2-oxohepta-3-ene-1,7-dioic acid hydratase in catechol pathway
VKLATFTVGARSSYGIVTPGGIIDAGARLAGRFPDLMSVLTADALGEVSRLADSAPDLRFEDVTLAKPLLRPGKIVCVGVNYRGRNEEYKDGTDQPVYPSLFMRTPESFVAHGEPMLRPPESAQLDYEGEVAVVIGRPGRRIPQESAMRHVAGYTVCNEGTVRDWCRHGKFNVTAGKNFARSGALGPFFVTSDEVSGDPLRIVTRVNGEVRQDETMERMIFPIPQLLSYISTFSTLEPGDVIVTGTPPGAGARFDPPRYLVAGDVVEVDVPGVGTLVNPVVDEHVPMRAAAAAGG